MKRVLLIAAALAALATPTIANDEVLARVDAVIERLDLTPEQEASVRPILEDGVSERLEILRSTGAQPGEKLTMRQMLGIRGPMKASRERTRRELDVVLTDAQMDELDVIVEEQRAAFREQHR